MRQLLILAALALGAPAADLPLTTLAQGAYGGFGPSLTDPREDVVDDQATWQIVWDELNGDRVPVPDAPRVDFAANRVVGITTERNTGGYSMTIERVRDEDAELVVDVRFVTPGEGCIVPQVVTQPHHYASIPRVDKPVRFEVTEEAHNCE